MTQSAPASPPPAPARPVDLRGRSLLSLDDLSDAEVDHLLATARALQEPISSGPLRGVSVALVFLNPSLRTRVAAEVAMADLGGHAAVLSPGNDAWKWEFRRGAVMDGDAVEHVRDAIGTLSTMVRGLGLRCFAGMRSWKEDAAEPVLRAVAEAARCPVYNLESAQDHPLQSLADLLALRDALGADLRGKPLALTWAPHPKPLPMAVPHAVLRMASRAGMAVRVCCPEGFEPDGAFLGSVRRAAEERGGSVSVHHDQAEGLSGAAAVYAKSWGAPSFYGRWEEERTPRAAAAGWTVTRERMAAAAPRARFLHCLPVRRNVVAADDVVEGPGSLVLNQARNRLLVQKAVFLETLRP
ncbi:MAG: N-acetylornithine carbamoyltransferase [Planctomycetes bacterium]|nr:N-acetylornithine carbamoyltransferase [Planctomycetota bacterium]